MKEYLDKFTNSLTILEFEKLFSEVKEFYPSDEEYPNLSEDENLAVAQLVMRAFWTRLGVYEKYIDRWEKGLFFPNDEELKNLKGHQKNLEEGGRVDEEIDKYVKASPSLADEYGKQRKEAKESKKKLDKLLKDDEPRQKAKELLRKYKDNPPLSGNNSDKDVENKFNEQITSLQNQIKDLENRQSQDSSLEKDHEYKKELERLKAELEKLKTKKKGGSQSERGQDKKNNFPTGLVVGGGIVVVVLLLIIIFLLKKIVK